MHAYRNGGRVVNDTVRCEVQLQCLHQRLLVNQKQHVVCVIHAKRHKQHKVSSLQQLNGMQSSRLAEMTASVFSLQYAKSVSSISSKDCSGAVTRVFCSKSIRRKKEAGPHTASSNLNQGLKRDTVTVDDKCSIEPTSLLSIQLHLIRDQAGPSHCTKICSHHNTRTSSMSLQGKARKGNETRLTQLPSSLKSKLTMEE